MIGISSENGKRFIVGLDVESILQVLAGKAVEIPLKNMGGPDIIVDICFSVSDKHAFNELRQAGLIHPDVEFGKTRPGVVRTIRITPPDDGPKGGGR